MTSTQFLLIRHGNTDAVGRYHAGRAAGLHLNDDGRQQVARLVRDLHGVELAAIVSSPLERTRQTADPIAADHGLEVQIDPAFIEIETGEWTGRTFAELAPTDEWRRYNTARAITCPPGGELLVDVQRRAVDALLKWQARHASGKIAIVSHGDVIRSSLQYFLGMPIDYVLRFEISPASISIVEIGDEWTRVLQVNGNSGTLTML
jgi:broad specificity phosphatase PhoE